MKKLASLLLFIGASVLYAQQKTHTVQPKETIYGISKTYNISQEALYKANPIIEKEGLHPGDILIIPGGKGNQTATPPAKETVTSTPTDQKQTPYEDDFYLYITIEPKENFYHLTRTYHVTEEKLRQLNPVQLKDGLKVGDIIRLPKPHVKTPPKQGSTATVKVPAGSHLVVKGETLYTIARNNKITVDDLYAQNPVLQTSELQEGMLISLPKKSGTVTIQEQTINYVVQSGDSAYDIIKRYSTSLDQLLALNPSLIDGLKAGMTLKIPLQAGAKITKFAEPGKVKRVNDNEINLVLMLPFELDNPAKIKNSEAMQFFSGAKIALNRLSKAGKSVHVKVIDTKGASTTMQSILSSHSFEKVDAIIGPLQSQNIMEVADFLNNSGIAIVSPFANEDLLNGYDNVLVANPREEFIADQIIDEIQKTFAGEQVYLIADNDHQDLANYTKKQLEKLSKANVVIVDSPSKIVQPNEKVGDVEYFTPITTVLISDNNTLGRQYLDKLKTLNKDNLKAYGIKAVDIYDVYNPDNAKNIDAFREFGFVFSTARLINTRDTEVKSVIKDFQDAYCSFPNRYEQLGYDVVYDIVDRMNSRGDVLNNLSSENTRLASKFAYKKTGSNKAYVNDSSRLVRLPKK